MNLTVDYSPPAYLFGHAALTDKSLNLIHEECQGFRIVDLGCGEGGLLKHLSGAQPLTYSIRCIGIDPSLPRTTADKSAGWMLTKSRWQDHEVGRLISSDTVVILSWPANTLDVEASASLISHLNHAAKVIIIGQETDGVDSHNHETPPSLSLLRAGVHPQMASIHNESGARNHAGKNHRYLWSESEERRYHVGK